MDTVFCVLVYPRQSRCTAFTGKLRAGSLQTLTLPTKVLQLYTQLLVLWSQSPVQSLLSICGSRTNAPTLHQNQNPCICKPITYLIVKHGGMCLESQGLLEYLSSVLA